MNHQDALNMILAQSCASTFDEDTKIGVYFIESCCVTMVVTARLVHSNPGRNIFLFEIIDCRLATPAEIDAA